MSDPVVLLSTGDVVGPAGGVTNNSMVMFNGTSGKLIKGNNAVVTAAGLALLDDVDAAAQRTTLGLKTGAVTNKTTSTTDPTVGSLTKVGDFGIGGMLDLQSTIFVTGKPQDLYSKGFVKGFADGGPAGLAIPGIVGINYGVLEVNAHWSEPSGADGIMRSFTKGGAGVVYTQTMANATTWGSWVKNGASAAWRLSTTAVIDLNTITEGGWFQGILGATNANLPALGYFYLQVMNYAASPGNCTQVAYEYASSTTAPRKFIRGNFAGTWTPWREIALINSPAFTGTPTAPTASAGTNTTQVATTAFVTTAVAAAPMLGIGQSWQDVTASRNWDTTYTNTTGKPIQISVNALDTVNGNLSIDLYVGGVKIANHFLGGSTQATVSAVVPPGATYRVVRLDTNDTILVWAELR